MSASARLPLARAKEALRAGAYTLALESIALAPPSAQSLLIEAQIANRQGRSARVVEVLTSPAATSVFCDRGERSLASAMLAVAALALRDTRAAAKYERAIGAEGDLPAKVAGDVGYYVAVLAWMRDDAQAALAAIARCPAKDPAARARLLLLRGWVEAAGGDFQAQARYVLDAIGLLEAEAPGEVALLANAAHALSALLRELYIPQAGPAIERLSRTLAWTPDLHVERFQTLRTLAWHHALAGRYIPAMRGLAQAKAEALTPAEQMLAHLDHADVAQAIGERYSLIAELALADEAYARIAWENVNGEAAIATIVAAQIYAAVDRERAQAYYAHAERLRESIAPTLALAHGRRVDAFFNEAASHVLAHDDPKRAGEAALEAMRVFERLGYRWRAGRAALQGYELTGDSHLLDRARELFAAYPESWLARTTEERYAGVQRKVTPRQREVLDLILQGKEDVEIARALGMRAPTVKVHRMALYKRYGVTRRYQLVAAAQQKSA
jgi:DNA-binding CsgD family transcriptional regulator